MAEAMSKSAKKRAAQKARAAAEEGGAAPAAPATAPVNAAPAKAEAKAQPKPKNEAKPKDTKPAQKAPPAKAVEVPEAPKKKDSDLNPSLLIDDGAGGDWSTAAGVSKKNQKKKDRQIEEARISKEDEKRLAAIEKQNQHVPGMATKAASQMAASKASQSVSAGGNTKDAAKTADTEEAKKKETEKTETVSIRCPEEKIGRVIGPKGSNLKLIQEKSGCGRIDTENGVFTVSGKADAVAIAEAALRELVDKGYTSLAFENFSDAAVMVHPSCFPDLIGTQGAVIRKIKEALKVEVSIPPVPKNAPPGKKYPVTIAGAKADAEKAKEVIESIVYYYHHEITHEGLDHVEMEIDPWSYSYVIGTKGSELRHIQKNYDVRIYIPRDNSQNPNVVIVGAKKDCDRAKAYIEKLIVKASEPRGRGAPDKADDHFGKEEDMEPWMQQYMYKRK